MPTRLVKIIHLETGKSIIGKVLNGAKPDDLPKRPVKFQLIVDLKTANELGITMPTSVHWVSSRDDTKLTRGQCQLIDKFSQTIRWINSACTGSANDSALCQSTRGASFLNPPGVRSVGGCSGLPHRNLTLWHKTVPAADHSRKREMKSCSRISLR
jgi:hypothetical protein